MSSSVAVFMLMIWFLCIELTVPESPVSGWTSSEVKSEILELEEPTSNDETVHSVDSTGK